MRIPKIVPWENIHIMDTKRKPANNSGSQSVDRALGLLSLIATSQSGEMSMVEIVRATKLSRPTARRLLLALMRAGLVEQGGDNGYMLGPEAMVIGAAASRRQNLLDAAIESLTVLAAETGDVCFVSARRENHSVCLHREEGSFLVRTHVLQAGARHPLGVGAGSMAILMALPDAQVDQIVKATRAEIDALYPDFTQEFIRTELAEARARGWTVNPGKYVASSWAIGVPVMGPGGLPAGSLSISAIDSRLTPQRQAELARLMQREATRVEVRLRSGNRPDPSRKQP